MNVAFEGTVRRVLASHLATTTENVQLAHRLRRDLGLLPFDLALVAQQLEELLALRIPAEPLASVRTVAELTKLVNACARDGGVRSRATRR